MHRYDVYALLLHLYSCCRSLLLLLAQLRYAVDKAQWVCGCARKPQIDVVSLQERTLDSGALGKQTSRYCLRTAYNQYLGLGNRVVAYVECLCHVLAYGARKHQAIGMAW